MEPSNPKPRGTPPRKFAGVRRSLYSESTLDGNAIKMRDGGMLPPICLYTGESVDPKVSPALEMVLVTKKEDRLGNQEESVAIRYFVSPAVRRWLLFRARVLYFLMLAGLLGWIGSAFTGSGTGPQEGANPTGIPYFAILFGVVVTVWIALSVYSRKLIKHFGGSNPVIARHDDGNVWISGVPPQVAQKVVSYFNTSPSIP